MVLASIVFLGVLSIISFEGCNKEEDRTRIDTIGGGLLPEQKIEVPCDFPESEPLVESN